MVVTEVKVALLLLRLKMDLILLPTLEIEVNLSHLMVKPVEVKIKKVDLAMI